MEIQLASTSRGGQHLIIDNFSYRIHTTVKNKKNWKCIKNKCCARAITEEGKLVKHSPLEVHNHPADENSVVLSEFRRQLKDKVKSDGETSVW